MGGSSGSGGIYYGWIIAAAAFLGLIVSMGARSAFGPFLLPMAGGTGLSRATLSAGVALSMLVFAVSSPFVGKLVDGWGGRRALIGGSLLLSFALYATGRAASAGEFFFWYGLAAAVGFAATGQVTFQALLNQWFIRRRGAVLSLLSAGAIGGIGVMTPASALAIDWLGWRNAYTLLAVLAFLAILLPALWIMRDRPEEMGLSPDGDPARSDPPGADRDGRNGAPDMSLAGACRTKSFWLLAGGYFTCGFSMNLLSTHGVPMLVDRGFSPLEASSALGVLGVVGILGAITLGTASDYLGRKNMLALIYLVRAAGFLLLLTAASPIHLYVLGGIAGLAWVGSAAMTSALIADLYGRVSTGTIFGWIYFVHQIGAAAGAYLGGSAYEASGDYAFSFIVTAVLLVLASWLSFRVPELGGGRSGLALAGGGPLPE